MLYELADCQPEVICLDEEEEKKCRWKKASPGIPAVQILKVKKTPLPSEKSPIVIVDLSNSSEKPSCQLPCSDTSKRVYGGFRTKPKRPLSVKEIIFRKKPRFGPKKTDVRIWKKGTLKRFPSTEYEDKVCQAASTKLSNKPLNLLGTSESVRKSSVPIQKLKFSRKHRPRDVLRDIKSARLMIDLDGNIDQPTNKFCAQDLKNEYVKRVMTMGEEKALDRKKSLELPSQVGRLVVFDTETTGLSNEDCLVEIGAVELINGEVTGVQFHSYINANRHSRPGALRVHGLTSDFLSKYRRIGRVLTSFFDWVGDARLIAHNAAFDVRMVNAELRRLKRPQLDLSNVFCSAVWYRSRYKGMPYNLNAVCKHLNIDTTHRTLHGALLDALLTAQAVQKLWHHSVGLEKRNDKNLIFVKKRKKT